MIQRKFELTIKEPTDALTTVLNVLYIGLNDPNTLANIIYEMPIEDAADLVAALIVSERTVVNMKVAVDTLFKAKGWNVSSLSTS